MKLSNIILKNEDFKEFNIFKKASDRNFYNNITKEYRKYILKNANNYLSLEIPLLKATDYLEYTKCGNRKNFEEMYFLRRKMLASLALAEVIEYRGVYIDIIIDLIDFNL